jgi:hypothetical protein
MGEGFLLSSSRGLTQIKLLHKILLINDSPILNIFLNHVLTHIGFGLPLSEF